LLSPCPQQTAEGPLCAETSLQTVKLTTKQEPFALYWPAKGLGRVAENTNMYFVNVAKLLQICRKTQSLCFVSHFVSLVWTRP